MTNYNMLNCHIYSDSMDVRRHIYHYGSGVIPYTSPSLPVTPHGAAPGLSLGADRRAPASLLAVTAPDQQPLRWQDLMEQGPSIGWVYYQSDHELGDKQLEAHPMPDGFRLGVAACHTGDGKRG